MTTASIAVITLAVAAIAWVNWYFFGSTGPSASASSGNGVQTQTIVVKGGYSPAIIQARSGSPLRLVFDRQETSGCSEEVVFPDFGVKRFLPAFEKTTVELTPDHAGTYEFTCGMGMLHGKVVVE